MVEQITIWRVVVCVAHAAVDQARRQNPTTKCNAASLQKPLRSARGGLDRFHVLITAKPSNARDLQS